MTEFSYFSGSVVPRNLIERASKEIYNFTISFVCGKQLIGSGTLVSCGPIFGIATAQHVSKRLFKDKSGDIGFVFLNQIHSVYEPVSHFEEIVVGAGTQEDLGPDLAYVRILDPLFISTIAARRSFYRLDCKDFGQFAELPYQKMRWFLAGAPDEMREILSRCPDGSPDTVRHSHFIAESDMESHESRDDFDFVRLRVTAGEHGFPIDYGGVSGGGMWLLPITMDPDIGPSTINFDSPFFAGVAFHQSGLTGRNRSITGHGPNSIYTKLVQRLVSTAANEQR